MSVCDRVYVCVCLSVFLSVCVAVSVCLLHDNSQNNGSIQLKLKHVVVNRNSSDEFDILHSLIKFKVTA